MLHFWHEVFMKCFKIITFWRHFSKNFIALTFSVRPQWPHSSRWVSCTEAWIPDLMSIFSIFFLPQQQEKKNRWGRLLWSRRWSSRQAHLPVCTWGSPCGPSEPSDAVGLHPTSTRPERPKPGAGWEPTTLYVFFPFHRDQHWIHLRRQTPGTPGRYLSSIQSQNIYVYFSLSLSCSYHV